MYLHDRNQCEAGKVAFKMSDEHNDGVAAVLSLVIPGAGQIYKGNLTDGFCWMAAVILGYLCMFFPGLILHIVCVYYAYQTE